MIDATREKEQGGVETSQFQNSTRQNKLLRRLGSLPAFGVILFIFVTVFPPLEVTTEVNLGVHMFQH
ncbi:MAG: hypothetical protein ACHQ1H_07270, partial [Nitrososphaerales archaeon]